MLYLLILIFPLLLYAIFAVAIMFHLKKYAIQGDSAPKIAAVFIFVSLVLSAFAIAAYLRVPWENLNLKDQLQILFNASSGINVK